MSDTPTSYASPVSEDTGRSIPPARNRSPLWMRILLIVSLAINLGIGGYAVARVIAGPRFVSAGPAASLMDARKLLWTLPREQRQALREEFKDRHFAEFMEQRRAWNEARQTLADTLTNEKASDEDIRRAYLGLGQIEAATAVRWREVLAELTVRVPPEARAEFADRMRHDHRDMPRRPHGPER
jgi:uncharacterized membrane protein